MTLGSLEPNVDGYYAMAAGAVSHRAATSAVRRTMPDPVPVMVLARLAVDHRAQGMKLGVSLLQDAVGRAVSVSQNDGVRALLVHALHDRAKQFYEHYLAMTQKHLADRWQVSIKTRRSW
ncbi:hypothetical protein ACG02S_24090 [Roseateles sp. DC23W]|uniref:Acetyltransferase (GNAT) family protein n=1 Tax=Pelomonas dachongensis TaxID=3299029 RepID=A0ABW7ETZ2_9BURK